MISQLMQDIFSECLISAVIGYSIKALIESLKWKKTKITKPPTGKAVLGYNKSWEQENESDAVCECYFQRFIEGEEKGYWVIAQWCYCHDEWHTRYSHEAAQDLGKTSKDQPYIDAPTYWTHKPKFTI